MPAPKDWSDPEEDYGTCSSAVTNSERGRNAGLVNRYKCAREVGAGDQCDVRYIPPTVGGHPVPVW
jgi:hypothetical protein